MCIYACTYMYMHIYICSPNGQFIFCCTVEPVVAAVVAQVVHHGRDECGQHIQRGRSHP